MFFIHLFFLALHPLFIGDIIPCIPSIRTWSHPHFLRPVRDNSFPHSQHSRAVRQKTSDGSGHLGQRLSHGVRHRPDDAFLGSSWPPSIGSTSGHFWTGSNQSNRNDILRIDPRKCILVDVSLLPPFTLTLFAYHTRFVLPLFYSFTIMTFWWTGGGYCSTLILIISGFILHLYLLCLLFLVSLSLCVDTQPSDTRGKAI